MSTTPEPRTLQNQLSREIMARMGEAIARGERCPICRSRWEPDPDRPGAQRLDHQPSCAYWAALDRIDQEDRMREEA